MTCYFWCVLWHAFLSFFSHLFNLFSFIFACTIVLVYAWGSCNYALFLFFDSCIVNLLFIWIMCLRFLSGKVNYYFNHLLLYNCNVLTAFFSFKKGLTKNVFKVTSVKKMDVIFLGQSGYPKLTSFLVALMLLPFICIMENWCCCRWWNKLCVSGNHLE